MRYNGINHLAMATSDMDGTVRFWRDLLGLRLVAGLGRPGYRQYFFEVSENDLIAFFEWPGVEPAEEKEAGAPVTGPFAFDHVSIGVVDEDALWEIKEGLEAADIWVSEVIDHGFIHSVYSFDPNGIALEFSSAIKGVDIRKSPKMADRSPVAAAKEGPEPQDGWWPGVKSRTLVADRRVYPGDGSKYFAGAP